MKLVERKLLYCANSSGERRIIEPELFSNTSHKHSGGKRSRELQVRVSTSLSQSSESPSTMPPDRRWRDAQQIATRTVIRDTVDLLYT